MIRSTGGSLITGKGLAGYITTADNRQLAFAIYVNNVSVSTDPAAATAVVGQALGEIAAAAYDARSARRCVRARPRAAREPLTARTCGSGHSGIQYGIPNDALSHASYHPRTPPMLLAALRPFIRLTSTQPAPDGITIRRVETTDEYDACVRMQHAIWGDRLHRDRARHHAHASRRRSAASPPAPSTANGRLLGFVFGMMGMIDGRLVHWSDLLAVHPDARNKGLGRRLKLFQRELLLPLGVETMFWTYDPLVAKNAYLNIVRLGARPAEYVVDMYGADTHTRAARRHRHRSLRRRVEAHAEWRRQCLPTPRSMRGTNDAPTRQCTEAPTVRLKPAAAPRRAARCGRGPRRGAGRHRRRDRARHCALLRGCAKTTRRVRSRTICERGYARDRLLAPHARRPLLLHPLTQRHLMIRVEQIELREIRLPLKEPFRISSGLCTERRIMLLQLADADGVDDVERVRGGRGAELHVRDDRHRVVRDHANTSRRACSASSSRSRPRCTRRSS